MAKRKLKPWHYQVTTALASITLLVVLLFFAQTFSTFFLTDQDPVLVTVERIKAKAENARAIKESAQQGADSAEESTGNPVQATE